jgi:hypothetical protein
MFDKLESINTGIEKLRNIKNPPAPNKKHKKAVKAMLVFHLLMITVRFALSYLSLLQPLVITY